MAHRLDVGTIRSHRETAEGFLDLHLTFSRIGPLVYQRVDGSFETEYLTENELFNQDSLATATGKPITWQHPPEWLTKHNARKYTRGSTGTKIIKDGDFAVIVATVHDAELIDVIKSGQAKEVSAGYTTKVVKDDDGKLYQCNRSYGHFAVVPVGRAGAAYRVHFDALHDDFGHLLPGMEVPQELSSNALGVVNVVVPGHQKPLRFSRSNPERAPESAGKLQNWQKPLRYSRRG